jgi:ferric-dicitrate binding protein FerR (iron transport regulator)
MHNISEKYQSLMVRIVSGEANEAEKAELNAWLQVSADHRKQFEQYKMIWGMEPSFSAKNTTNRETVWQRITEEIDSIDSQHAEKNRRIVKFPRALTLSAIAAVGLIFLGLFLFMPKSEKTILFSFEDDINHQPLELSDGTMVFFKTEGSLAYPETFSKNTRKVELTGDAFFEVTHNPAKPFVVEMNQVSIVVKGTSFLISQYDQTSDVDVSVVTGKISMMLNDDPQTSIDLVAGERGTFSSSEKKLSKKIITDYNFMAWKTGKLEFSETPLSKVFDVLQETYKIKIHHNDSLPDVKLTARFVNESHEDIFTTINLLYSLDIEFKQGIYYIK